MMKYLLVKSVKNCNASMWKANIQKSEKVFDQSLTFLGVCDSRFTKMLCLTVCHSSFVVWHV